MGIETVTIGCKLPSGILLEIGIQTTNPEKGFTALKRTEKYASFHLRGWHSHNKTGLRLPAELKPMPYINRNVPKAFWEQWKSEHTDSWLLKNGILFEAKNEADALAQSVDAQQAPTPFAPMDAKDISNGIEAADFDTNIKKAG